MPTKASNRRRLRNFIIEPKFQWRFVSLLLVASVVPVVFTVALIWYFLNENYLILVNLASLDPETTSILRWELRFLITAIICAFTLFILAVTIVGIIFSHRIAGVIYKLRKTMHEITTGQNVELSFRTHDEFTDLADEFNRMVKTLREKPITQAS